jgi:hypothetical protein
MSQEASHRFLTAETWVRFVSDEVSLERFLLLLAWFSPVSVVLVILYNLSHRDNALLRQASG